MKKSALLQLSDGATAGPELLAALEANGFLRTMLDDAAFYAANSLVTDRFA